MRAFVAQRVVKAYRTGALIEMKLWVRRNKPLAASLLAAARPAEVPYLYFVSRNDGSHVFASTLAEHNRNVNRWQKVYWQKRWAEERNRDNEP